MSDARRRAEGDQITAAIRAVGRVTAAETRTKVDHIQPDATEPGQFRVRMVSDLGRDDLAAAVRVLVTLTPPNRLVPVIMNARLFASAQTAVHLTDPERAEGGQAK